MLDTRFERVKGDVGNPQTFDYPVRYQTVAGASVDQIVNRKRPDKKLVSGFIDAARQLESQGAVGLITSCGFLSVLQNEIAQAVRIPVITSSLNLIPLMRLSLGGRPIGVLTADATQLSETALTAVKVNPNEVRIAGMETSKVFNDLILNPAGKPFDQSALAKDILTRAQTLQKQHPDLAALVLECTNLQPYAQAIQKSLGLPVVGIKNAADLLWQSAM